MANDMSENNNNPSDISLVQTEEGLVLTDGKLSMKGDFSGMLPRLKQGNLEREILVKAVRIKGVKNEDITVVDATAGMGEDSLLLAAAGFKVLLFEKNHVIASLLEDALQRAKKEEMLAKTVSRMTFSEGSSVEAMNKMKKGDADVIYLDPMFPQRSKSGLIKKKFQLLQQIESPCDDEEELLFAAKKAEPKKIVIKRPLKGPFLAGIKPDYSVNGKAIRYDVIFVQ